MEPFTQLEGVVAPLDAVNVDTDMIIPAVYLKSIARAGFGPHLFDRYRYLENGAENPDFILNRDGYRNAKILVSGPNFGCGLLPGTRPLGPGGLRHPLRHRPQLRRHLLQQLLQKRPAPLDPCPKPTSAASSTRPTPTPASASPWTWKPSRCATPTRRS